MNEPLSHDERPDIPAGISSAELREAFKNHPAGVAIITADPGTGPVGMTVTSVSSVSAEPANFVFSLSSDSSSTPAIRASKTVVVHLLGADDIDLARLFATSGIDRFADTNMWSRLATGEPYIVGARLWIRAQIIDCMEAGASTMILARALETHFGDDAHAAPLVYHNRTWHRLDEHSQIG